MRVRGVPWCVSIQHAYRKRYSVLRILYSYQRVLQPAALYCLRFFGSTTVKCSPAPPTEDWGFLTEPIDNKRLQLMTILRCEPPVHIEAVYASYPRLESLSSSLVFFTPKKNGFLRLFFQRMFGLCFFSFVSFCFVIDVRTNSHLSYPFQPKKKPKTDEGSQRIWKFEFLVEPVSREVLKGF